MARKTMASWGVVLHPGPSFDDYTLHLANALAPLIPIAFALDHRQIARFRDAIAPEVTILPYRRPRRRHLWGWSEMRRLAHAARRFAPRVILHIQGFGLWESVLARFCRRACTVVDTVHDPVNHLDYRTPLNNWLLRDTVRQASAWVVHSPRMKALLLQQHPQVNPQWVAIHPIGPYTYYRRYLSPYPLKRRSEILFFGEPRLNKGIDLLLLAFEQVANTMPEWQLVLAGQGRLPKTARRPFARLVQKGRVVRLNRFLSDAEVARLFAETGFVALPYRHGTQSAVLAVAAAIGTPALVTPVGNFPEILTPGQDAYFVSPENIAALAAGLQTLAQNEALRRRLGTRLRAHAERTWSWERSAQILVAFYTRLQAHTEGLEGRIPPQPTPNKPPHPSQRTADE